MKARGNEKHFTLGELADFARNAGDRGQLKAMKQHLDSCGKCATIADTWLRVAQAAHRLPAAEPPEAAVRRAKALYSAHGPEKRAPLTSILAELLFDTSLVPLQAGVRSSAAAPRQLLFGSGDYRVDLRIEPEQDADTVSLMGQVLHASDDRDLAAIPISLIDGRKVVRESRTNRFGEFHFQFDLKPGLELRIMLPDAQLSIPLVDPLGQGAKRNPYLIGAAYFSEDSTKKQN
jgi:hypothetical protein